MTLHLPSPVHAVPGLSLRWWRRRGHPERGPTVRQAAEAVDVLQHVLAVGAGDQPAAVEVGEDAVDAGPCPAAEGGEVRLGEAPVDDGTVGRRPLPGAGRQAEQPFRDPALEVQEQQVVDQPVLGDHLPARIDSSASAADG